MPNLEQSKPYGETFIINKLECVGHIQKRLGCRLRTLRQTYKGKKLSDVNGISDKGRLTDRDINLHQNYFGMTARQNSDVPSMKKAIGTVLFHCLESECDEQRHLFRTRTENSWRKWQSDQITGKETYKTKISLPSAIKTLIKPIFVDLSNNSLLEKCLHHKTQNVNESLNGLIWNRCPKSVNCSNKIIKIGVCSAIIAFKDGFYGLEKVFHELHFLPGYFFGSGALKSYNKRVVNSSRKASDATEKARKHLRAVRKGHLDMAAEKEGGESYKSGAF